MSSPFSASAVFDRIYLEVRSKLLDVAASLDRIERADGSAAVHADPRLGQIEDGIAILADRGCDRAERIQLLFSDPYLAQWNRPAKGTGNGTGQS